MRHIRLGQAYYRVCARWWRDAADTQFSKKFGGRWNPPGEFGTLYLNRNYATALANATLVLRRELGNAVSLRVVAPAYLPDLQFFSVKETAFVDALTKSGLLALALPADYPKNVPHEPCREIGRAAYRQNESGIASRCAQDVTGEELAVFDRSVNAVVRKQKRVPFAQWRMKAASS